MTDNVPTAQPSFTLKNIGQVALLVTEPNKTTLKKLDIQESYSSSLIGNHSVDIVTSHQDESRAQTRVQLFTVNYEENSFTIHTIPNNISVNLKAGNVRVQFSTSV